MKTFRPQSRPEPVPKPGVIVGDEVYCHHPKGPHAGKVVAHGKHGVTLEGGHKVRWEHVLGHKRRAGQEYTVVDEGEDGCIVQDRNGLRQFIAVPPEAREEQMVVKSRGDQRMALFLKSDGMTPYMGRAGLTKKQIVDRRGVQTTKWVKTGEDPKKGRQDRGHDDGPRGSAKGYGTHNLDTGDRVHFAAGTAKGSGHIVGKPGQHGAHVRDETGRVHRVHWHEITGHEPGDAKKPEVKPEVRGPQAKVPAANFNASAFAREHDQADVTPEHVLSSFPPDTADKIRDVQQRLASIEQTIDKFKRGDTYSEDRIKLHRTIFNHFLSPEKIAAARPPEGQKPTVTFLGGRGGSGKSWFKGKVYDEATAIVMDPDEIKAMMPEYEGWNAAQVHEESGEIFDDILRFSRRMGLNIVVDATMKTSKSTIAKVTEFKGSGYRVEAHYMHLPRQEAAKRAVARFLGKTKRYVPVEVVLSNTGNEETFDQVRRMADAWSFRDNNVPQGADPVLISQSEDAADGAQEAAPLKKAHGAAIIFFGAKK